MSCRKEFPVMVVVEGLGLERDQEQSFTAMWNPPASMRSWLLRRWLMCFNAQSEIPRAEGQMTWIFLDLP